MIAIYERVSGAKPELASQRTELEAWASGKTEVTYYTDKFSGKSVLRPGMERLLADVRAGHVRSLVVWRLDRLGRTAKGVVALLDELAERKVNFISLRDGIDLSTPSGRLIANVLKSVASYETEVRGERVRAGLNAKRQRVAAGKERWNNGRPKGTGKLQPKIIKAVKAMKADNIPIAHIANALNLSRTSVYAALKAKG